MKKFKCDDARGTHAEQHARNPRETRNADAPNPCVLLILLVVVVVAVVVVAVVVISSNK